MSGAHIQWKIKRYCGVPNLFLVSVVLHWSHGSEVRGQKLVIEFLAIFLGVFLCHLSLLSKSRIGQANVLTCRARKEHFLDTGTDVPEVEAVYCHWPVASCALPSILSFWCPTLGRAAFPPQCSGHTCLPPSQLLAADSVKWGGSQKLSSFYPLKHPRWDQCLTEGESFRISKCVHATFASFLGIRSTEKAGSYWLLLHGTFIRRNRHTAERISSGWTWRTTERSIPVFTGGSAERQVYISKPSSPYWYHCFSPFLPILDDYKLNSKKDCVHKMHQEDK